MLQRRICEYLGLSCTHDRTFLCLPPAARYQVYAEVGVIDDSDLTFSGQDNREFWFPTEDLENCWNLLLSCRTVYAEVSQRLYSSNRFFIQYKKSEGLEVLRNLRPSSLASLTHLTVHLNVTSCQLGRPCFKARSGRDQDRNVQDSSLRVSSRKSWDLLSEWQNTLRYMAAHLKPSQLRLHLVCDAEDLEIARQVAKPITDIPLLAECSVRLAQQPSSSIKRLARETGMRATGYLPDRHTSSFRFLDLPLELRQKILEYTDLVTPLREVEWNPKDGFYLRYSAWRCGDEWDCPSEMHHACHFRNCWERSNTGCFCSRYHAAFSSNCHCWSPPISLFLICRALRDQAQAIFFASNRFVITASAGCHTRAESTPARLEASVFLLNVVPRTALYYLRFLEVVIPPFDEDYLQPHEPAYEEWNLTIDKVKEKLNLPLLTVRIYFAEFKSGFNSGPRPFHANVTQAQRSTLLKTYARIVATWSKLQGLGRCFVHIAWPLDWTAEGRRLRYRDPEFQIRGIQSIEQKLEQRVMGSDYDAASLGKSELRNSQWLEESMNGSEYGE